MSFEREHMNQANEEARGSAKNQTKNKWLPALAVVLVVLAVGLFLQMGEDDSPVNAEVWGNNVNSETELESGSAENSNDDLTANNENDNEDNFVIRYRAVREEGRARQVANLQEYIDDDWYAIEERADAKKQMIELCDLIEQEKMLDSLLTEQFGYEAAVGIEQSVVMVYLVSEDKNDITAEKQEEIARFVDTYTGIGYEHVVVAVMD